MQHIEIALAAAALTAIIHFFWNTRAFVEERERARVEDRQRKAALRAARTMRVELAESRRSARGLRVPVVRHAGIPAKFGYGIPSIRLPAQLLAPRPDEV
jgi:hypothetical protein